MDELNEIIETKTLLCAIKELAEQSETLEAFKMALSKIVEKNEKRAIKNIENDFEEMSDEQFNTFLEQLAKLIETQALNVSDAAKLVRQAKTE